ncbi:MAG: UDP-galactopyranose mutase [Epsilonproteobacteria bacterium]|nr:UDP-galactopyranose mutase [Campylobacterota bacterium]
MKKDVVIVGGGFAGAVSARLFADAGHKVRVIEKRPHIGGNCFDAKDEAGILVHRYGPHLFHTDYKEVVGFLSRFCEWSAYEHRVLAKVDDKDISLPFNFHTLYECFESLHAKRLEDKLLLHYGAGVKVPILELLRSEDAELKELAEYIYENIFVGYTTKMWGISPHEIDAAVTARVPIFTGYDGRYFHDSFQALPKEGYTKLFERMLSHADISIELGVDFLEIASLRDTEISIEGEVFDGVVIYTGALDELFGYRFGALPYRSLELEFETLACEYFQNAATVNYPKSEDFTRITEFKHIHPVACEETTILKEYPCEYKRGENIPYYPIFTPQNQELYEKYLSHAKNYANLVLLGRLAEYRYYDMDDIIKRVLDFFKENFARG